VRAALRLFDVKAASSTIGDVQMDIVRKTAPFGPVLLLAPNDDARTEITSNCSALEICELLDNGRVRIAVVPHDSVWVRDYGPLIELRGDGVHVVDSTYYDIRQDESVNAFLKGLLKQRLELLKHALRAEDQDPLDPLDTLLSRSSTDTKTEIELFKQYSDALRESISYGQRTADDRSPFGIAQTVLKDPGFTFHSTKLYIDGGNLLKLEDGACLTTKELQVRNPEAHNELSNEIKRLYGCNDVVFLEALPGPVIEHVDMFVLPVGRKKLILPNYKLNQPYIEAGWKNMSESERDLTFEAAVTMERNAASLRARGYDIVLAPALPPRTDSDGDVFYPTLLNALVRTDGSGAKQVLVPSYDGLQDEVQGQALKVIQAEFGSAAQVVMVEATVAAKAQGAIHCLTITVPYSASVFRDAIESGVSDIVSARNRLDAANRHVTNPRLRGTWTASPAGPTKRKNSSIRMEVTFGEESKLRLSLDGESLSGTFRATEDPSLKWPLELLFEGGKRKTVGRAEWLTDKSFKLVLADGDVLLMNKKATLLDLDTAGRELRAGMDAKGMLKDNDERDSDGSLIQAWAIKGKAGEALTLDLLSDAFDTVLKIVGPGLEQPLEDDDSGSDGKNSRLSLAFPEDGDYSIIVKAFDKSGYGEFTLRATPSRTVDVAKDWANPGALAFLKSLRPQQQELRVGSRVNSELTASTAISPQGFPVQAWTLPTCSGSVRVTAKSDDFDTVLIILGSDTEEPIVNDDDESDFLGSDSAVQLECSSSRNYRIFVSAFASSERGSFTISVNALNK